MPKTDIQIIDPTKHKGWDNLLLTNENSSFFHTSGWVEEFKARTLSDKINRIQRI